MLRLLASFASVLAVPSVQAADPVPRYKFEPGQEITYRTTSTFEDGERKSAGERGSRTDWTLWVVRSNEDGSYRLVIRQDEASYVFVDGEKKERVAQSRLVYADVFPDGRILPNDTIKFQGHPEPIFPMLPKDAAEAANGWAWQQDDGKINARPLPGKGFRFEAVTESPLNVIYLSSSKSVYTMDQALISGVKTINIPGHGIQGKWIDTTELLGASRQPTRPWRGNWRPSTAGTSRALGRTTRRCRPPWRRRLKTRRNKWRRRLPRSSWLMSLTQC